MILVVCLNPALDITHQVPVVDWAGVNRPAVVLERAGGKGTNVARTLLPFGIDLVLLGFAGGTTGSAVRAGLRRLAVPAAFTVITGETRRTFTVVDGSGRAALFNEPGPEVSPAEFARFRAAYTAALPGAAAVVLSGSLPRGLSDSSYAELIALAAEAGVPAVLDTHGAALRRGVLAGPAIVKPNLSELEELAGEPLSSGGRADLLAVTADGCWRARPADPVTGNATGAGDAATAALVHGLVLGRPWDDRLRHAAALGAAAVAAPAAGEFSDPAYVAGLRTVTVQEETVCP